MKKCDECLEIFKWNDDVLTVDDRLFHKECVELIPMGYIAMVNDYPVGEVENDDMACFVLDDGEYLESESE